MTKYEVRLTEPEIMRETYWTCNYGDHIVEAESKGEAIKKVLQALEDGDIEVQEYVEDHYDDPNEPEPPKPEIDEVVVVSDNEEAEEF